MDTTELERPTVVEIWAPTCGHCKAMQPDLDAVAAAHRDAVDLVVVDVSGDPDTARRLGAMATPTLIGFRDGEERFRVRGRRSRDELEQLFASLTAPDGSVEPIQTGRTDRRIRLAAGVAVAALGLVVGEWILVAVGALIVVASELIARRS